MSFSFHSTDGVATAKSYWAIPGSSEGVVGTWMDVEGEASFCGGCHDATPGDRNGEAEDGLAPNIMGDNSSFGFYITGHGKESGNFPKLSWQDDSATGNPAASKSCSDCHSLATSHFNSSSKRLKPGFENDQLNTNCSNCHPPGVSAIGDPQFYTNSGAYETSAHKVKLCTECHNVHGAEGTYPAMTKGDKEGLCFQCHTEGMVQNDALANNRTGGHVSADDIQEAFSKSSLSSTVKK